MNFADPILYQARTRPNTPAVILPGEVIRFAQLDSFSHSIATHLLQAGVGPGDLVVIATAQPENVILVTLALARLGAIGVANITDFGKDEAQHWATRLGVKAVCRTEVDPAIEGVASLVLDKSWLSVPARLGPLPPAATEQDTILRVMFSSGTTGTVKAIPVSHGAVAQRLVSYQFGASICADDRLLVLANLNAGPGFHAAFKHLCVGSPVVVAPFKTFMDFVAVQNRNAITQVAATAFTLMRVLESAPSASGPARSSATVNFAGAALPEAVWRKAARLFAGPVLSHYGSTEAGPAAFGDVSLLDRHPDAVGRLLPWIRVEAVDDDDHPLPAGEQGILRVRAPGMTHRYIDDPAASAAAFRDGWFYPGDVGAVTIDGILRVGGRSDDLLNLGGKKIAPSTLENVLSGLPNVREVAAAAMREPHGLPSVGVGVVADAPLDLQTMTARCREIVSTHIPVHVVQLDAIPRNEAGKILRRELAARISSARAKIAIVP